MNLSEEKTSNKQNKRPTFRWKKTFPGIHVHGCNIIHTKYPPPPPPPRKTKQKNDNKYNKKGEREKGSIYIKYTLKENLPGSRNKTEMASSKTRTEIISYQCCSNAGGIEKDTTCLLAEKNEILLTVYFAHVHT